MSEAKFHTQINFNMLIPNIIINIFRYILDLCVEFWVRMVRIFTVVFLAIIALIFINRHIRELSCIKDYECILV
jgi:TctA family transporter